MANGLKSVELVKMYKKQFPSLQKLICVLKQFLLQRDLNEVRKPKPKLKKPTTLNQIVYSFF